VQNKTYRTGLAFPIERDETLVVRDGQGRAVERWTVRGIVEYKSSKDVTFSQIGYKRADHL